MAVKKKPVKKKMVHKPKPTTVKIQRGSLLKALNVTGRAIPGNSPLPILSNVLFECANGESSMVATDLELGIRYVFESEGVPLKTCVPSTTFRGLMEAMGDTEVELVLKDEDQSILVTTDTSTSSIKCVSPNEFPDIPKVEDAQVMVSVEIFKNMVNRVAFASSRRNEGSVFEGVNLKVEKVKKKTYFIMFSADGYRSSFEKTDETVLNGEEVSVIIKGGNLETIAKTLPDEGMLEIEFRENKALFHCENIDIIAQTMTGNFPDYHLLMKSVEDRSTTLTLSTLELLRACKQLKVFAKNTGATKMEIQELMVQYSTLEQANGNTSVTLIGNKDGEDMNVSLNVFFLSEFLEIAKTTEVVMQFEGNKKPILLTMEGVDNYWHIILPISLKE